MATENKQEKPKDRPFIKWLNKAGKSWKDFWDKPVTVQYAYNPHAVVGNGGAPFSSTQRRGDFATLTAAAIAIPATAAGVATVGVVPTLVGMGAGMGAGIVADVGGSKLVELAGGDENALEMVGDIAGFTLGALAGGKATKVTTNYLNFWNSLLSPRSIYTATAEGMTPPTTQKYGLVKYYGPTMGKTTAARTNPKLVDFDDIVRDPIAKLAAKKGVTPRDLKISNDPDYISLLETEVARWRMNPANAGKTLVISNKALSSSTTGYNNLPSIPDKETFIARQVLRGGNREEAAAYYDALIENNPNLKIDNRFVSDIESGTRAAQISEAERLGLPKGERNAYLIGANADPSYYAAIGLNNPGYTQALRDFHFTLKFGLNGVNENGLVTFYHGSPNPNKTSLRRPGIKYGGRATKGLGWFATTNKKYAQRYTVPHLLRNTPPTGKVYELYINSQKPYIFGTHQPIGTLALADVTVPTLQTMQKYWRNGFQDLYYPFKMGNKGSEYVIFNPTLFKFRDPITYDNHGRIIPLSKRDNPTLNDMRYKSGGSIHIKKKNKGKFTASAKAAGEGVQEHAHKVMNDPNATSLQKKRANFAIQAKKWHHKHQSGGIINYLNYFNYGG